MRRKRERERRANKKKQERNIYIYINVYKERWNGEESEIFSLKTNLSFLLSKDGE